MRPQVITLTAPGTSAWIPVDFYKLPTNITLALTINGTATASVDFTADDVWDPAVTPVAFPVTAMTGVSTNTVGNIAFPVRAIRLSASAVTGSVTLTILQGRSS